MSKIKDFLFDEIENQERSYYSGYSSARMNNVDMKAAYNRYIASKNKNFTKSKSDKKNVNA